MTDNPRDKKQEPWEETINIGKNVQRVLHDFAEGIFRELRPEGAEDVIIRGHGPNADVYEGGTEVLVFVDLPGMKQEDIEVAYDAGLLVLEGTRGAPMAADSGHKRLGGEKAYGRFRKEVRIPGKIAVDGISAQLRQGVLCVTLPKKPEASKIKIDVKG